jgi:hypothetical protein
MANSQFWRKFEEEFEKLQDPCAELRANSTCPIGSGELGRWCLCGASNADLNIRFEALARRAGAALMGDAKCDPMTFWLEMLKRRSPTIDSSLLNVDGIEYLTATIEHVCRASATLCFELRMVDDAEADPVPAKLESSEKNGSTHAAVFAEDTERVRVSTIRPISAATEPSVDESKRIGAGPTPHETRDAPDPVAAERKALLQAYKDECRKGNIRVTDEMIAEAASRSWHERTPVQRWKRNDRRSTPADDAQIRAVLKNKPHLT